MRLSLVGPVYPFRGGIAFVTATSGQELIAAGHQVQVISFARQYPSWLYPGTSDKDPSRKYAQVPARFLLDPLSPLTWKRAAEQIVQFHPQLALIPWWTSFWAPAFWSLSLLLRRRKIPVAFVVHNVLQHESRFFDRWLAQETLKQGDALIFLSPQEGRRLKGLLPESRLFVSRLPLLNIGGGRMQRAAARQLLGLPCQAEILLFFGFVRPYKGLAVLIEALGELHKKGIQPLLLVVGEFWENAQRYHRLIDELGLIDQVRMVDRFVPNEEVGFYFSAADAFVAPYVGGTQSASIKVAMNYRLPVLASDRIAGDLPVERYPFLIHPTGDIQALALAIKKFFQEPPPPAPEQDVSGSWKDLIKTIENVGLQCGENHR